jgi:hypothetical protein
MRRCSFVFWCAAMVCLLVPSGQVRASSVGFNVTFTGDGTNFSSNFGSYWGGEFEAYNVTAPVGLLATQASPVRLVDNTFQTFCVEFQEDVNLGVQYYATLDDRVLYNGEQNSTGVPLYDATALLFSKFWNGSLNGYAGETYNYTLGNGREESAKSLERAIWAIQNHDLSYLQKEGLSSPDARAGAWYNQAILDVGGALSTGNPFNVTVMNVWKDQASAYTWDGREQSQLVMVGPQFAPPVAVPLPSSVAGGGAMLLLMLARYKWRGRRAA